MYTCTHVFINMPQSIFVCIIFMESYFPFLNKKRAKACVHTTINMNMGVYNDKVCGCIDVITCTSRQQQGPLSLSLASLASPVFVFFSWNNALTARV